MESKKERTEVEEERNKSVQIKFCPIMHYPKIYFRTKMQHSENLFSKIYIRLDLVMLDIIWLYDMNMNWTRYKKIIKIRYDTNKKINTTRIHEYVKIIWIKKYIKIYIILKYDTIQVHKLLNLYWIMEIQYMSEDVKKGKELPSALKDQRWMECEEWGILIFEKVSDEFWRTVFLG